MDSRYPENIIDLISCAVVQVDFNHVVVGYNNAFKRWFEPLNDNCSVLGCDFYETLCTPHIRDGNMAPFFFAAQSKKSVRSVLEMTDPRAIASVLKQSGQPENMPVVLEMLVSFNTEIDSFIVELRDISELSSFDSQLNALQKVGAELPKFVNDVEASNKTENPENKKKEQKQKLMDVIKEHMENALSFQSFEIRTLDERTKELVPFLSFGIAESAADKKLYVGSSGNGIIGYVADSREAYLCNDAKNDPLYLEGAVPDAKCSLTVPIFYDNRVIGVINVESSTLNAFSARDLLFLQLYAKDLALALQLLEFSESQRKEQRRLCGLVLEQKLPALIDAHFDKACCVRHAIENRCEGLDSHDGSAPDLLICDSLIDSVRQIADVVKNLPSQFLDERLTDELSKTALAQRKVSVGLSKKAADAEKVVQYFFQHHNWRCLIYSPSKTLFACGQWLHSFGASVDKTTSGAAALQALATCEYQLILSDLFADVKYITDDICENLPVDSQRHTIYDVHKPGYFEQIDLSESELAKRRKIKLLVNAYHLDCFFFYRNLREVYKRLNKPTIPIFLVATPRDRDKTHAFTDIKSVLVEKNAPERDRIDNFSIEDGVPQYGSFLLSLSRRCNIVN